MTLIENENNIVKNPETETPKKRILVADDEPTVALFLRIALERAGYEVVTAANGQEAFAKLNDQKGFDLFITDYNMPHATGLEVISAIRESDNERLRETPIIMVSSTFSKQILGQLAKWGVPSQTKPLELPEFTQRINLMLKAPEIPNE